MNVVSELLLSFLYVFMDKNKATKIPILIILIFVRKLEMQGKVLSGLKGIYYGFQNK